METIWKNSGGFVDGRTILRCILKELVALLCYYGDDMKEYRRLCRREDSIKMYLKGISSFAMLLWRRYGRMQEAL